MAFEARYQPEIKNERSFLIRAGTYLFERKIHREFIAVCSPCRSRSHDKGGGGGEDYIEEEVSL